MDLNFQGPYVLNNKIEISASKSYSIRALLALLIYPESITIEGLGDSMDEVAALDLVKLLLNDFEQTSDKSCRAKGGFDFDRDVVLRCEESGLLARMLSMLFLLNKKSTKIQGLGSLNQRPFNTALNFYQEHQIPFHANGIYLPIELFSRIDFHEIHFDGAESSQYISGLIYYFLANSNNEEATIYLKNIVSKPYIDMTIELVNSLGAEVNWTDEKTLKINPFKELKPTKIIIEKDWSAAAVWIVAATLGGRVELSGLNPNSLQADKVILDIVKKVGAKAVWTPQGDLIIEKGDLNPFEVDATDFPDLIPVLSVLAYFLNGTSMIKGTNRLIHKESNRKKAILEGFKQLDYQIEERDDVFIINKNEKPMPIEQEIELDSYGDHRMVMAWSILGLMLPNPITVTDLESVRKSYVDFEYQIKKIIE